MKFAFGPRFFSRFARLAVVATLAAALDGAPAPAQDSGFGGFFQQFFGGGQGAKPPDPNAQKQAAKKKVRDFVPATATREPGTPGGAAVLPTFFIEVVGDSLASFTAGGLSEAFADKPEIAVVDKTHDASGLVRSDYYDWQKAAGDLAGDKDHINFVVMMFGINDLQAIRDGADNLDPLSDRWKAAYAARVDAILAPFLSANIPVAWVGMPPMRVEKFNDQIVKLNEIDREEVEKAGAKYIDIWDAFANQNGQFDAFGPNVDGQTVKLRGPDGIHFTKAGGRKAAHFIEADIRRIFDKDRPLNAGTDLPPDIEQAAGDINSQIRHEAGAPDEPGAPARLEPVKPLSGPILSLTGRPTSPNGLLAKSADIPPGQTDVIAKVLRQGEPADPRGGRADDFSWPRL
ncbi:MAG: DUF459 domain-containing protein [Bradyrhizobium sp.]|nr:MAG: DUF459 domain-containing protein [Bradyrhizobium sp.]